MGVVRKLPEPVAAPLVLDRELVATPGTSSFDGGHVGRNLDCRWYGSCLDVATARGWEGFACGACGAYEPLSEDERMRDLVGLCELYHAAERAVNSNEAPELPPELEPIDGDIRKLLDAMAARRAGGDDDLG